MKKLLFTACFFWIGCLFCLAQQNEYGALTSQLQLQKSRQDSTQKAIASSRKLLETNPENRDSYTKKIIALEDELYAINSKIAELNAKIVVIEAQMPTDNNRQQGGSVKESAYLYDNSFFVSNISKADLELIRTGSKAEARAGELIAEILPLYEELKGVKTAYDEAKTPREVEELLTKAIELRRKIEEIDGQIAEGWGRVFQVKTDNYVVLLDKATGIDRIKLEQLENENRSVRRAESLAEAGMARNATVFALQKQLTVNYELLLADKLSLRLATEALAKESASVASLPRESFPEVEFKPRVLIVYSDIVLDGNYDFTRVDDIPELIVPERGVYYAVGVATMAQKPTTLKFFRGGRPLHVVNLPGKQLQYVLGGFQTYAQVQTSVQKMLKAGFKNPVIAAWVDGKYTTAAKAKAAQEVIAKESRMSYKIEIKTTNVNISKTLNEVVEMHARGKQVSRVQNGAEFIFTIMEFDSKEQADVIAEILRTKGNTKVEVISIE